jgi:hypothetical protein
MSQRTKALLIATGAFVATAIAFYFVAKLIIGLVVVLASIAAGLAVAAFAYNSVLGRPTDLRRWRRPR